MQSNDKVSAIFTERGEVNKIHSTVELCIFNVLQFRAIISRYYSESSQPKTTLDLYENRSVLSDYVHMKYYMHLNQL